MQTFVLISLGAILGANARFWVSGWAAGRWGTAFPVGTVLINISGSLLLGLGVSLSAGRLTLDPRLRNLLIVGFLGSYTTFSTYPNESVQFLLDGRWAPGPVNLIGSAIAGGAAAAVGIVIGNWLSS